MCTNSYVFIINSFRRKKEKDIATLADQVNQFEKELEEGGMQIRKIRKINFTGSKTN
jgi:hypothetical protein